MRKILFLFITMCVSSISCSSDAWNLDNKYADDMPDIVRHIFETEGKNKPAPPSYLKNYGERFNITPSEAQARLNVESKLQGFSNYFRKQMSTRIAGSWIEHEPEYKFVHLLKGDEKIPDWMNKIVVDGVLVIEVRTGAKYSLDELKELQNASMENLKVEFGDSINGIGIDQKNNGLTIDFYSEDNKKIFSKQDLIERLYKYNSESIQQLLEMPLKINTTPAKLKTAIGITKAKDSDISDSPLAIMGGIYPSGSKLTKTVNGSTYICSVGEGIERWTGVERMFLTSEHCQDAMKMTDIDTGQSTSTTTWWGIRDSERDYKFIKLDSGTPTNLVYRNFKYDNNYPISEWTITQWSPKSYQYTGMIVQYTGATSGTASAMITDAYYKPNPAGGCDGNGLACANTWIKADEWGLSPTGYPYTRCAGGDSGAAVYVPDMWLGLVSFANFSNGKCYHLVYQELSYIREDGNYQEDILTIP